MKLALLVLQEKLALPVPQVKLVLLVPPARQAQLEKLALLVQQA